MPRWAGWSLRVCFATLGVMGKVDFRQVERGLGTELKTVNQAPAELIRLGDLWYA
jgi:hypothetical protein